MKSNPEDVKIELEPEKVPFKKASITPSENNVNRPLTKEEIEELLKDPFWRNFRRCVITFFWLCWVVTLVLTVWIVWNAQPRKTFRESNVSGCTEILPYLKEDYKESDAVATDFTAVNSTRDNEKFEIVLGKNGNRYRPYILKFKST